MRSWSLVGLLVIPAIVCAGCSSYTKESDLRALYLCNTSGDNATDLVQVLSAHGFHPMFLNANWGWHGIGINGSQESVFRARQFVLQEAMARAWKIDWLADLAHAFQDEYGTARSMGSSWVRVASVRHREVSTEQLLDRLHRGGVRTQFEFGSTTDFIFVQRQDAASAATLLRVDPSPSVVVHDLR